MGKHRKTGKTREIDSGKKDVLGRAIKWSANHFANEENGNTKKSQVSGSAVPSYDEATHTELGAERVTSWYPSDFVDVDEHGNPSDGEDEQQALDMFLTSAAGDDMVDKLVNVEQASRSEKFLWDKFRNNEFYPEQISEALCSSRDAVFIEDGEFRIDRDACEDGAGAIVQSYEDWKEQWAVPMSDSMADAMDAMHNGTGGAALAASPDRAYSVKELVDYAKYDPIALLNDVQVEDKLFGHDFGVIAGLDSGDELAEKAADIDDWNHNERGRSQMAQKVPTDADGEPFHEDYFYDSDGHSYDEDEVEEILVGNADAMTTRYEKIGVAYARGELNSYQRAWAEKHLDGNYGDEDKRWWKKDPR